MDKRSINRALNAVIDGFWAGVDMARGTRTRIDEGKKKSDRRRRARAAERAKKVEQAAERRKTEPAAKDADNAESPGTDRSKRPAATGPTTSGATAAGATTGESKDDSAQSTPPDIAPDTIDVAVVGSEEDPESAPASDSPMAQIRRLMPNLAFLQRREKKPKKPKSKKVACSECGHENTPPVLFCEHCQESLINLSKTLVLGLLSLALACFFASEYFRGTDYVQWPWPMYVFYGVAFLVTNAALMRKAPGLSLVAFTWGVTFISGGLLAFFFGVDILIDGAFTAAGTFTAMLEREPVAFYVFASGFALAGAILAIALSRRYGFAHAYRIVLFCAGAGVFGAKYLYQYSLQFEAVSKALSSFDESQIMGLAEMAAVNALRILVLEIVVFSIVRAVGPTRMAFAKRRIAPRKARHTGPRTAIDPAIDVIYSLAITLANGFTRFYLQIEYGFYEMAKLLRDFGRGLAHFLWTLTRDLIIPVASLTAVAWALRELSIATGNYIMDHELIDVARAVGYVTALVVAQFFFLSAKTRLHPRRLLRSQLLLSIWSAPYVLMLFIFMSASLWAAGAVIARWNPDHQIGFSIGPVTLGALGLTFAFLVYAVIRRHREEDEPDAAVEPEGPAGDVQ